MKKLLSHPVFQLSIASAMTQAVSLLLIPVVTRIFSPDVVGELSIFTSYSAVVLGLIFFQGDRLIVSAAKANVESIVQACLTVALAIGLGSFAVLIVLHCFEVAGYGLLSVAVLWCFLPFLLVQALQKLWKVLAIQNGDFKTIGYAQFASGASVNVFKIIFGLFKSSSLSLVMAELIAWLISFLMIFRKNKYPIQLSGLKKLKDVYLNNRGFLTLGQLSGFLYGFSQLIPIQILSSQYGLAAAGVYAMALRIASVPMAHLGAARSDYLQNHLSKLLLTSGNQELVRSILKKSILRDILMGFGIYIFLALFGSYFIDDFLGPKWVDAGQFIPSLCIWLLGAYIVSPYSQILIILKRNDLKIIYDGVTLAFLILAWVVQDQVRLPVVSFVTFLSCLQFATYLIYAWLIRRSLVSFFRSQRSTPLSPETGKE